MRILKVIHGYPQRYNAGSEVYSQLLVQELANKHNVEVFTRQEDSFAQDFSYKTENDSLDARILLNIINVPRAKYRDAYVHAQVDAKFKKVLSDLNPDIVHFGHLNHLSLNLPQVAKDFKIPTIMTLHDFWLMCPRGQFVQRNSEKPWQLCTGQDNGKCALKCYCGSYTGDSEHLKEDSQYWESWISRRMEKAREAVKYIDHFIAPSNYLRDRFIGEFDIKPDKITYLDYGFNRRRLSGRSRVKEDKFVFGFIGTHTPQKGIHLLLEAFSKLNADSILKIWGFSREDTSSLQQIARELNSSNTIEWMGGYHNNNIVRDVFNNVDAIVVPSIWGENSPLVIHEAQQVRVPVITADYGGMKEYVKHMENGLLFRHLDAEDLSQKMQLLVEDQILAETLSKRGYLYSDDGDIPDIKAHAEKVENLYFNIIEDSGRIFARRPGPWRITFDTNPDHCNYKCVMCECFSPYSKVKDDRVEKGIRKRVMPIETIEKVLRESKGTPLREIIPSTMGEPLLYKDFGRIIDLCHEYNLKLNLTTNGSFPIKGALNWSKLLVPILSDVKISINGATKQTNDQIMIGSKFDSMISNIKTLIKERDDYFLETGNRCRVTFQATFLENNIHELEDLLQLAISLGVDRLKGHHLWAHFDEIKDLSMRRSIESITKWNIVAANLHRIAQDNPLANNKHILLENVFPLSENGAKDIAPGATCPFLGKEAWVNTQGEFAPCCAPDELRKKLGSFGNLEEKTMSDIWLSADYKNLSKTYFQYDLCKNCNMRKPLIS